MTSTRQHKASGLLVTNGGIFLRGLVAGLGDTIGGSRCIRIEGGTGNQGCDCSGNQARGFAHFILLIILMDRHFAYKSRRQAAQS